MHRIITYVLRYLIGLWVDDMRRRIAVKLTLLLSALAYCALAIVLVTVCLVFVSIAAWHLMASAMSPHTAYLLIAAFYLAVLIVVTLFRQKILTPPISRFIARLLR
jgi:hypothetical protein